ncbi:MAG: hypothetical protein AAGB93_13005 [Planctomycetota bacterium]
MDRPDSAARLRRPGPDRRGHVVEQDVVGPAADGRASLVLVARLARDDELGTEVRAQRAEDGLDRTPGEVHVVLLHHRLVEEADPVVDSTADAHGVLVERAEPGRGLARVHDPHAGALDQVDRLPCP